MSERLYVIRGIRILAFTLFFFLGLLFVGACAERRVETPAECWMMADIISYTERADHLDFSDGEGASYDVSMIVVRQPDSQKGKRIEIIHNSPPASNSVWRIPHARISFSVPSVLIDKDTLFVTGIHNLHREK